MRRAPDLLSLTLLLAAIAASGPLGAAPTLDCPDGPQGGVVGGAKSGVTLPTVDAVLPKLIDHVEPRFPESARVSRLEGKVILQVIVDRGGRVGGIEVLNCGVTPLGKEIDEEASKEACASFAAAASDAVLRWRYEPARLEESPICVYYTIRVDFRIKKDRGEGERLLDAEREI